MLLLFLQLLLLVCSSSRAKVMLYPDGDVLSFCEDDAFVIRCVTNTGLLVWSFGDITATFSHLIHSSTAVGLGNSVTVVLVSSSANQFTSVATVLKAQSTLNGTVLSCKDNGDDEGGPEARTKFLIAGNPSKPTNVKFKAIDLTSVTIHWTPPFDNSNCIVNYVVYLETDDITYNTTTTSTSQSIGPLSRGVEYSVKVAAVDRMGQVSENATIQLTLEVPQSVMEMKVMITKTCTGPTLFVSWKQPPSSFRPPVMHYTVRHNITSRGSFIQVTTKLTNMTISGAQSGRVYLIEVKAVNVLGPGPPKNVINLATVTDEQMHATCSCAVELGASISVCCLLMVAACFLTAVIVIKKDAIAKVVNNLLQRCKEKLLNIGGSSDPSMMNPNIAYEEQEPGYTETFHKYHNSNTTLVRVDCHVYDKPAKTSDCQ